MNDVIEIENCVNEQGYRLVHLMSNREITSVDLIGYWPPEWARIGINKEGGAYHLRATWQHIDMIEVRPGQRYVIRDISQGERISQAVSQAVRDYLRSFGHGPQYAYLHRLPKGVRLGYVIRYMGWEIILLQADWVPDGRVAVGEPGTQIDEVSERFEADVLPAPMVVTE